MTGDKTRRAEYFRRHESARDGLAMKERPKVEDDGVWKHCSNSAVRRAARQLGKLYAEALGDDEVGSTQFSLLSQIAVSGEPTVKALAEAMVMDISALGHTLKVLIRDRLVELVPSDEDRRVKRVRLTTRGRAKQEELTARWRAAQDRFDRAFGIERSAALRETLAFIASPAFAKAFAGKDDVRGG